MKNGSYESRKEQIEKNFAPTLSRNLSAMGFLLSRKAKNRIKQELRDAAMVGACEERSRILGLLRDDPNHNVLRERITLVPVLKVLGYEE